MNEMIDQTKFLKLNNDRLSGFAKKLVMLLESKHWKVQNKY
jgi:hypothetical protein